MTTAIERSVVDDVASLVQEIHNKHGIRINALAFEWVDVSTTVEARRTELISNVRAEIEAQPSP